MKEDLRKAISSVKQHEYSFCKFISPNEAGETGSHQTGVYIPKSSSQLLFSKPGIKGEKLERTANIIWPNNTTSESRFFYYGQGTRNEYRITGLGRKLTVGELFVLIKLNENIYEAYLFSDPEDIESFLNEFNLNREDLNNPIGKSESNRELNFKPKAHILTLLGEELIKSPVMAIYELIKNSYDADAKEVKVIFENIENIKEANIVISDDGLGITEEVLKNVWFEPGSDFRKPISQEGKRVIKRSTIYNRIPMGEKGVGRFAVHKLGHQIHLISRPANVIFDSEGKFSHTEPLPYEISVEIDWRKFSQSKYLEDLNIQWFKISEPESFHFQDAHGTLIIISDLKEIWTRGMARQLKRNTLSMLSPKNDINKFKINLDFKNWWLQNMPDSSEILNQAPYKLIAFVDSNYNMTFEYSFELKNNSSIGKHAISNTSTNELDKKKYCRNIRGDLKSYYRSILQRKEANNDSIEVLLTEFNTESIPFGPLYLEVYSFDLDSPSLRDTTNSPSLVKELLKEHAGIKVFKGDLRVYDYGDPGNDWLGLDLKRVQNKEWFSNNQNVGYIFLDAETSSTLIEKTNREGFIENNAFEYFKLLLEFILTEFKSERQIDRNKWSNFHKKPAIHSFKSQLNSLKELITSNVNEEKAKQQMLLEAVRIEDQYEKERNTLLLPAGVGMTASFAMHEIEKLVPRMEENVKSSPVNIDLIRANISELKDYVEGILSVLKKGGNKPVLISDSVNQTILNFSLRLRLRKISVTLNLDKSADQITCDKRYLITVLMNIVDNSVHWLDVIYKEYKGIYITNYRKSETSIAILIVDNGPGFKDSAEDIVMPFFSRKEGGIGIGMYLVDTIMMRYGKLNIIYDKEYLLDRGVPEHFDGAAVELTFSEK